MAITLALEMPKLHIAATDISMDALRVAAENARKFGALGRVHLACADWLKPFARRRMFKLVVSNPPYVDETVKDWLAPEVRDHEPSVALFGGRGHPLETIEKLYPEVRARLAPGGLFLCEFGAAQEDDIQRIAKASGFTSIEIKRDFAGIERTLVASAE
jgi:release factor glutamine methyltransferase